jgi:hypothetical protein
VSGRESGGGGLTGATGNLTPDDTDAAFEPGERREFGDPAVQAEMTTAQGARADAQRGHIGHPEDEPVGGPTNLADRDMGYGSQHGLDPDDPAYRMESHPGAGGADVAGKPSGRQAEGQTRIGGDELRDDEPHF